MNPHTLGYYYGMKSGNSDLFWSYKNDLDHQGRLSGSGTAVWIFETSPHQSKKGEEGGKMADSITKPKQKYKKWGKI